MSLEARPRTAIKIIPPTPIASTTAADPPPNSTATVTAGNDDTAFQRVADDKIESTSEWLRHHSDIFTHLSAGLTNVPDFTQLHSPLKHP